MKLAIAAVAVGAMLTLGLGPTLPAHAQRSAVSRGAAARVMTPEQRRRGTDTKFDQAFDVRRLSEPAYAFQLHDQAGTIAKCLVRRGGSAAPGYLGGVLVGDPDYGRIGEALNGRMRNCLGEEMSATAIAISGALAEELLAAQSPQFEDRAASVNEDEAEKFFGDLSGQVTIDNLAGCLAVYSPGLAYKVVQSEAGSKEEAAALEALYKQTPECGLSTTPSSIPVLYQRGAVATALYKWSTRAA